MSEQTLSNLSYSKIKSNFDIKDIKINKSEQPNFIGCWLIKKDDICKKIIDFFESNISKQVQGVTTSGVDLTKKKRIDIKITPNDLKNELLLIELVPSGSV